jgi:hypothetical protein
VIEIAVDDPKILYHYTTQEGFLGILGSRQLWASGIRQLNDASEFIYPLEIARKVAHELQSTDTVTETLDHSLTLIKEVMDVYVVSFSREKDQLEQWRAYCREAGGFSIGFDLQAMRELGVAQDYMLRPCNYDTQDHEVTIRALIENLAESLRHGRDGKTEFLFLQRFMSLAPTLKHSSFQAEQEWRLSTSQPIAVRDTPEICYRPGKSFFVPYRKFSLRDASGNLPIREVVVGPTPHPDLSVRSVRTFLFSHGVTDVEVSKSTIPYRSW